MFTDPFSLISLNPSLIGYWFNENTTGFSVVFSGKFSNIRPLEESSIDLHVLPGWSMPPALA
jgi:hypothetical protein